MCDEYLHDELITIGESICFLCNGLLDKGNADIEQCCDTPNIEVFDCIMCTNCGVIRSYCFDTEFVDFYQNIYRIRRKSIYCRKYHIENTFNDLQIDHGLILSCSQRDRIQKAFAVIGTILDTININRRRMISTRYIILKMLEMMNLSFDKIPITKSKRTLKYYNEYWDKIDDLPYYRKLTLHEIKVLEINAT